MDSHPGIIIYATSQMKEKERKKRVKKHKKKGEKEKRKKKESRTATTQEYCEQYWTNLEGSTTQSSSCTATYHQSRKLFKLNEPDMRDTAGEVGTNS